MPKQPSVKNIEQIRQKSSPSPPKMTTQSSRKELAAKISPKKPLPVTFADCKIAGWGVSEKDLKLKLEAYIATLPIHFKKSFAALDTLIANMSSGYDAHFMSLLDTDGKLQGLFAFNVDTMV